MTVRRMSQVIKKKLLRCKWKRILAQPRLSATLVSLTWIVERERKTPRKSKKLQSPRKRRRKKFRPAQETKKRHSRSSLTLLIKKCAELSPKLGETVDFALFIRDVIHDPKAKHTSPMAEKIISFTSGTLKEMFQEQGLRYNPDTYFDLASEKNFKPSEFQEAEAEKTKNEAEAEETKKVAEAETTKKVEDKPKKVAKEIKDKGLGKKSKKTEEVRELSPYEKIRVDNIAKLKIKLAAVGKCSDLNKDDIENADDTEKEK